MCLVFSRFQNGKGNWFINIVMQDALLLLLVVQNMVHLIRLLDITTVVILDIFTVVSL
jgi:hypothetical protein